MTIPPQSVQQWTALFGGISYRRGHSLFILVTGFFQYLIAENKQKEVPRFLYSYTNGGLEPTSQETTTSNEKTVYCSCDFCYRG